MLYDLCRSGLNCRIPSRLLCFHMNGRYCHNYAFSSNSATTRLQRWLDILQFNTPRSAGVRLLHNAIKLEGLLFPTFCTLLRWKGERSGGCNMGADL